MAEWTSNLLRLWLNVIKTSLFRATICFEKRIVEWNGVMFLYMKVLLPHKRQNFYFWALFVLKWRQWRSWGSNLQSEVPCSTAGPYNPLEYVYGVTILTYYLYKLQQKYCPHPTIHQSIDTYSPINMKYLSNVSLLHFSVVLLHLSGYHCESDSEIIIFLPVKTLDT